MAAPIILGVLALLGFIGVALHSVRLWWALRQGAFKRHDGTGITRLADQPKRFWFQLAAQAALFILPSAVIAALCLWMLL